MPQYDINKVDTSSFTPEQLGAFNSAKALIPPIASTTPAPTKPVTLLSSATGADIVGKNKETLSNIEQSITIPQGATLSGLANKYGTSVQDIMKNNPNIKDPDVIQAGASLRLPLTVSGSPATSKMAADINTATQNGMTPDERTGLRNLQSSQDAVTTAAAKARAALDAKDYTSMDYWTNKATADRQQYEKQLSDYYEQTKTLRQRVTENLTPSEKEQQLQQQVVDIRGQAEAFKLRTEEDKFREYEGQTLGFAGGRASEIDLRASFKNQEFALKEKNLLLSLGLEQSAREMEGKSIEQQLGYLADDLELQQKVQEKITASEEKVFERADTLQKEQKDTLIKLLDGMQGVDPSTLPPETRKQLEDMAARAGLPFDLVETALKTQHDKQVFDEAMKRAAEKRLSDTSNKTESLSVLDIARYNELYPDAGVTAGDTEAQANAKVQASNSPEAKTRNLVVAAQTAGNSYETVVAEINKDTTIKDKAAALAIAKEVYAVEETAVSPIETEIARLKASGILTNADIRSTLLKKYGQQAVNDSSIGSFVDKIGSFLFGK